MGECAPPGQYGPSQAEVETALAAFALGAITASPAPPPFAEPFPWPVRAHRGWPLPASLNAALAGEAVTVTVRAKPGTWRETTRWPAQWQTDLAAPGITVTVAGDTATFTGAGSAGQAAGIAAGGQGWIYRCRDGDTAELVAASLAQLVLPTRLAIATGAGLRLPGAVDLLARTGADAAARREVRRQEQVFEVTLWCPDPYARDWAGELLDLAVSGAPFLDVGGEACRLLGQGVSDDDGAETARLYKREAGLLVEYPTMERAVQPTMLFGIVAQEGSAQGEAFG
jgi:hypothetical protein